MRTARDVADLVRLLDAHGIEVWIDGGWGVDALLGEQTRPHGDLDIAVRDVDVPRLRDLLATRGYQERPRDDTTAWMFVLADPSGREIDIHAFALDADGNHAAGVAYPAGSL